MGWFEKSLKDILAILVGQKFEFKTSTGRIEHWEIKAILSDRSLSKYQKKTGLSRDQLYKFIMSKSRRKKRIKYSDLHGKTKYKFIVKNLDENADENRKIVTAPCDEFDRYLKTGNIKFI